MISQWSFRAGATGPQLKFKVGRAAGGNNFTIIGESELESMIPNTLNVFATRISVQPGDVIGFFIQDNGLCGRLSGSGYGLVDIGGDQSVGTTASFSPTSPGTQIEIAATLEPDADADGFGDETQDGCADNRLRQDDCVPPETEITKGAPNKLDKDKVKFKFRSDERGSTFECKLDKKKFKACTSPQTVKHLDGGKHKFKVVATDAAGNVDPSAAKDKFKVVG